MHVVPIGTVSTLCMLWAGLMNFDGANDAALPPDYVQPDYVLKDLWPVMGLEMTNASRHIPSVLGPAPLDLCAKWRYFKKRVCSQVCL